MGPGLQYYYQISSDTNKYFRHSCKALFVAAEFHQHPLVFSRVEKLNEFAFSA